MGECVRCPCGQFLDLDDRAECPVCGRLPRRPPERVGLQIVLTLAGLLTAISLIGILIAVVSQKPSPTPPPTAAIQAVEAPPIPPPPPVVVPPPAENIVPPPEPVPPPPPVEKPLPRPAPPRAGTLEAHPVDVVGGYKVGDTLPQDATVTRRTTYRIMGLDVSQGTKYTLGSTLTVKAIKDDGSLVVEQTVRTAKFLDADPDAKADLIAALDKVKGTTFELTIGPTGEVVAIKGLKDPVTVTRGKNELADTFRLGTLMDADGWKELAGLMFFQPEGSIKTGAKWNKPFAHAWGPLGGWDGKTNYVARGKPGQSTLDRIDYGHAIKYRPPEADADRDLPFRVGKADFQLLAAGGAVLYDADKRRSAAAEEDFHVRGFVQAFLGDAQVVIELEERQNVKLTFVPPGHGELTGMPKKK